MPKPSPSKSSKKEKAYLRGILAEYACAGYLLLKGYSILYMRYRNVGGEIDIIAKKGRTVIFTEVKARAAKEAALHSITPTKQQVLIRAAEGFLATHKKYFQHDLRFDVMVVTSPANIHHIKDAWRL